VVSSGPFPINFNFYSLCLSISITCSLFLCAICIDFAYIIHNSKVLWFFTKGGRSSDCRSSDTDVDLPIVSADLFTNFKSKTIASSLQIGLCGRDKITSSLENGLFRSNTIASLLQNGSFGSDNIASSLQNGITGSDQIALSLQMAYLEATQLLYRCIALK
jgi:hypothetical protein